MSIDKITELLGDQAGYFLNHESKTLGKDKLYLPGPDFIERVVYDSNRNPRVLRSFKTTV
jgi:fructose-bisphosphate aldolase, class I